MFQRIQTAISLALRFSAEQDSESGSELAPFGGVNHRSPNVSERRNGIVQPGPNRRIFGREMANGGARGLVAGSAPRVLEGSARWSATL